MKTIPKIVITEIIAPNATSPSENHVFPCPSPDPAPAISQRSDNDCWSMLQKFLDSWATTSIYHKYIVVIVTRTLAARKQRIRRNRYPRYYCSTSYGVLGSTKYETRDLTGSGSKYHADQKLLRSWVSLSFNCFTIQFYNMQSYHDFPRVRWTVRSLSRIVYNWPFSKVYARDWGEGVARWPYTGTYTRHTQSHRRIHIKVLVPQSAKVSVCPWE